VKLVCLLPARNAEADLPGWLESVSLFADAVVALDDGSTDRTRELLEASPLVRVLLANPRRDGYEGWDDAANRNRLLEAAAGLEPEWLLSLDADERIAPDDAAALRGFVEREAIPGFVFGFRSYRMWGDLDHHEAVGYWVYRLFAYDAGQRFPEQRLHFDPIPTSIPAERHLLTTLRIQHLAGLTPERRAARIAKYEQADPERAFPYHYRDTAADADGVHRWEPRPPELPVLATAPDPEPAPALSAIVISRDDEDRIERTVRSVVEQESPWPFEVIVVTSGTDRTAEIVRTRFPQVALVALPRPALPGEARNAGLRVARGDYVSFPGSHVELPPGSLAARIAAHDLGHTMVTGTTLGGTDTPAGRASYFLDHAEVLPGRPSTVLDAPPAHCSYARQALLDVGGFPEHLRAGEDTVVNHELARRGHSAYRAQEVRLVHHSPCRTRRRLVRHYFVRGRSFGRILIERHRTSGRLLQTQGLRTLYRMQVRDRVTTIDRRVEAWGGPDERRSYASVRGWVRAGATAHWLGTCFELARPRRAAAFVLLGRPVVTIPAGSGWARVDVVSRRAKLVGADASAPGIGSALRADVPLADRLTLVWAAIVPLDVHAVELRDPAALERHLETRSRGERRPAVATQPPTPRPLFQR